MTTGEDARRARVEQESARVTESGRGAGDVEHVHRTAMLTADPLRVIGLAVVSLVIATWIVVSIWIFARPLALIFLAFVIAVAITPAVDWLARWLPRTLAVLAVYVLLAGLLVAIMSIVLPQLAQQTERAITTLPDRLGQLRAFVDQFDPTSDNRLAEELGGQVSTLTGLLTDLPLWIASSSLELVVVVIMSVYWLFTKDQLRSFTLSFFPPPHRERADSLLTEMGTVLGGYLRTVSLSAVIVGVVVYVGLTVLGVEYPLVLALVAGVGEFVPIAGSIVSAAIGIGVALLESPGKALIVAVFYLAVQQFEGNILVPNLMGRQTDVSPLLVLFAVLVGGATGSILGVLVAIPLVGILQVLIGRGLAPLVRARLNGSPASPLATERESTSDPR